ncbi:MAG: leucine-rich repeat protein [Clostridia bacterium]|nr:leucine-rich repeat protein [Clostridia bacterium]
MTKLYKITIIIFLLLACCTLYSCTQNATFEDITITGNNVSDLPEGVYTLRYSIENLDKYARNHDYSLLVTVTDRDNKQIDVENSRIIQIESDNVYYVTILLTAENGERTKTHNYTVSALKSDVVVTFSAGNYQNFADITRSVPYGGTLTDIPAVPAYTPPALEGFTRTVTKSEWSRKDYTSLLQNTTVTAIYEITDTMNSYTITYDTDGGTAIAAQTLLYSSSLTEPAPPTKIGAVFFGWYGDEARTEPFVFGIIKKNFVAYARWITPNDSTDESYFTFIENTDGRYYTIRAKERWNMPDTVVIPNTHNGKAVTKIDNNGFAQCAQIKHITVPETVDEIGVNAFSARIMQSDPIVTALETVTFLQTSDLITIKNSAFLDCDKLTSVNIPDSVAHIEAKAFYGCTSLQTVAISQSSKLQQISDEAFFGCSALTEITLQQKLNRICERAFYNCTALSSVTLYSEAAPLLDNGYVFGYFDGGTDKKLSLTIYVLPELLNTYGSLEVYDGYDLQAIA